MPGQLCAPHCPHRMPPSPQIHHFEEAYFFRVSFSPPREETRLQNGRGGESPLPAGQGVHPCYHHQHPHHHRKCTLSAHLQVVIARCHVFTGNGISMEKQPMESGDPRVDGERVFPQILLQIVHPAFPVTRFFSFPSLYETSLNDHEPSIANE